MSESQNLPNAQRLLDTGALDLDEAFNISYFVISPLKSKCIEATESTPGPDFEGSCEVQQITQDKSKNFFHLKIAGNLSYIKVYAQEPQVLVEEIAQKIQLAFEKLRDIIPEKRQHISYMINHKRQIELLLTDLLKRVPARPTYFRVANVREGIIRMIEGFSEDEQDIATVFQDLTMQYQTVISVLTNKQDDVSVFTEDEVKRIGIVYMKSKEYINNYIESILGLQKKVKL